VASPTAAVLRVLGVERVAAARRVVLADGGAVGDPVRAARLRDHSGLSLRGAAMPGGAASGVLPRRSYGSRAGGAAIGSSADRPRARRRASSRARPTDQRSGATLYHQQRRSALDAARSQRGVGPVAPAPGGRCQPAL